MRSLLVPVLLVLTSQKKQLHLRLTCIASRGYPVIRLHMLLYCTSKKGRTDTHGGGSAPPWKFKNSDSVQTRLHTAGDSFAPKKQLRGTDLDFFFFWTLKFLEYWFGGKSALTMTNLKMQQDSVNQIFNPNAFFFFFLTGATWYYHGIYIVFTYFASVTGYEDDILEAMSN